MDNEPDEPTEPGSVPPRTTDERAATGDPPQGSDWPPVAAETPLVPQSRGWSMAAKLTVIALAVALSGALGFAAFTVKAKSDSESRAASKEKGLDSKNASLRSELRDTNSRSDRAKERYETCYAQLELFINVNDELWELQQEYDAKFDEYLLAPLDPAVEAPILGELDRIERETAAAIVEYEVAARALSDDCGVEPMSFFDEPPGSA